MRKTFLLASLILSAFILASVASPQAPAYHVTASTKITAGDTLTWKLLAQIKYLKKPSKDYPEGVMFPVINTTLKAKNNKPILMSGFIIPIDNKSYALSKNVFASCFFCGQAGPETIMGIKFKNPGMKLKTDQYVTLQGNFRYNDADVDDWIYHIENAVIVSK
ncbi:hypothetical protein FMM05_03040 [Flavobacterium zepuense]|uniref:DUF3299 domain-containing protein n=1 Tax=Flavobacterium zepuense TaxID=2593302 RepID=A0A552V7D3_9FLAO|nr:hypothetical protein [Flavobacterium zepuense]TRW26370.1 hypothetical protein FMM05_03040 [Flavobacterium zepuense]